MTGNLGERLPELVLPDAGQDRDRGHKPQLPSAVLRIPVSVQVVIGTARLSLAQVAELAPGATVTLEEKLGTPARMLVNGREVARGELFVLDGEGDRLGLTITDVSGHSQSSS